MLGFNLYHLRSYERAIRFAGGEAVELLMPGWRVTLDRVFGQRVERFSMREPWLFHRDLDLIVKAGVLGDEARVVDLASHQRAVVWVDGRCDRLVGPGVHALWTSYADVVVEVFDSREALFEHAELATIADNLFADDFLDVHVVPEGQVGLAFVDGRLAHTLEAGRHAFWKGSGEVEVVVVDRRQQVLDVAGQEIMTADRVSLRINAVVAFRVADALRAVTEAGDYQQALYRTAQLALRTAVGGRELDDLLADKDGVAAKLEEELRRKAIEIGVEVVAFGIRDLILPGEMRELLNRVTEAKKAAEAALITRREETAAMRSQANTARLLENNETLMRLRELELLEKIASSSKMKVVLGEKGLSERVMDLL